MDSSAKTLGRVAMEAVYASLPWDALSDSDKDKWENAAEAVRQLVEQWHLCGVKQFAERETMNGNEVAPNVLWRTFKCSKCGEVFERHGTPLVVLCNLCLSDFAARRK